MTPAKITEQTVGDGALTAADAGLMADGPIVVGQVELDVSGMTCASCVSRVQRALSREPGVAEATVNLVTGRATVDVVSGAVEPKRLAEVVERLGYGARALDGQRDDAGRGGRRARGRGGPRPVRLAAANRAGRCR